MFTEYDDILTVEEVAYAHELQRSSEETAVVLENLLGK